MRRKEIWIVGGTGSRLDHLWANVQCLQIALDAGAKCKDYGQSQPDPASESGNYAEAEEAFGPYFSLFPLNFRWMTLISAGQNIR